MENKKENNDIKQNEKEEMKENNIQQNKIEEIKEKNILQKEKEEIDKKKEIGNTNNTEGQKEKENIKKNNIQQDENKKNDENNDLNESKNLIPIRDNIKKKSLIISKVYLNLQEEIEKRDAIIISIKDIDDLRIKEFYKILKKQKQRKPKENDEILFFLLKTKFKENLKSDLLYTGFNSETLLNFMIPYISGNIFNNGHIIYSYGDVAENFYVILKGTIGQYELVTTTESLTCEDYFSFLCKQYTHFKNVLIESKENKNLYLNENEYADVDLLYKIVSKNKEVYPLFSFDDIEELERIMLEIKLYVILVENKPGDIINIFKQFNMPLTHLNYDKLLKKEITGHEFIQNLSKKIKKREKFYMKYLGKNAEFNVTLMKYVKIKKLKPYDYFGNFEMIDARPYRTDTARCESDYVVLMEINKKLYSKAINNIQREKREKEIKYLHNDFYFKMINRIYFDIKMFIRYKLDSFLKGHILINQGEKINHFIFSREGTIETSINNVSLLELAENIKILNDYIIKKAREYKINVKEIIDFDVSLNDKTSLKYELIEGILKQKQNFVLSISDKGAFGEYEYYFDRPSFITATVTSKESKIYFYDFDNFRKINDEIHSLNESLRMISFGKLKSILKRMISVYNSNFIFNIKQIEEKIKDNEEKLKKLDSINSNSNDIDINFFQKTLHFSSPITLFKKNNINLVNLISFNTKYNDYNLKNNNKFNFKKFNINSLSYNFDKTVKYNQNSFNLIKKYQSNKKNDILPKKAFNFKNLDINKKMNSSTISTDKISIENDRAFKTFHNKKILKFKKTNNNSTKKKEACNSEQKILKTGYALKKRLFDVFLPPLLTEDTNNKKIDKIKDQDIKEQEANNKYNKYNQIYKTYGINEIKLRKKSDKNIENFSFKFPLSNIIKDKKKDIKKKSNSSDIKTAQINIIKNRDKKRKIILQRKNVEDLYNEYDF